MVCLASCGAAPLIKPAMLPLLALHYSLGRDLEVLYFVHCISSQPKERPHIVVASQPLCGRGEHRLSRLMWGALVWMCVTVPCSSC